MAKLIICCAGRPALNGHKRRTFLWSEEYKSFVHEGRELTEAELNACCEAVFKKNWDLHPYVKVAKFSDGEATTPADDGSKAKIADLQDKLAAARADAHAARNAANATILELTAKIDKLEAEVAPARLATVPNLDEALEIVARLAPDRLKKRMGRPPASEAASMEVEG